jgi:hypothetical protein
MIMPLIMVIRLAITRGVTRVTSDPSEGHFQGPGGPWMASHPRDPLGPARSQRRLLGGERHLGTPTGGLCIRPQSMGLGATHFLLPLPSTVLHLSFAFLFIFCM